MSIQTLNKDSFTEEIQGIFAEITRYPIDILEKEANLEEDLGIDSVKLAEIFSVIRQKYNLPEDLVIPPEQLQSIEKIATALIDHLSTTPQESAVETPVQPTSPEPTATATPSVPTQATAPATTQSVAPSQSPEDISTALQGIFADVTRYPIDILEKDANLEEDLGIDSVKLAEIFSIVREKYSLAEDLVIPPEDLQSINKIAAAITPHIGSSERSTQSTVVEPQDTTVVANTTQHTPATEQASTQPIDDKKPTLDLHGKIIFISGSGRGLGKAFAQSFAAQGAHVIVNSFHSRNLGEETAKEINNAGGKATHLWGSMANPDHVKDIFNKIEEKFGYLDALIANASNGMLAKFEDLRVEDWEKAYKTNVIGLHQCAVNAARLMKKKGKGKIITLSSPAAHGHVDYFGCMGSVKAAVESMTRSMAIEFEPYNIQVNGISPGPIYGDLLNKWPESTKLIDYWESKTPYPRLCKNEDITNFASYLLQDSTEYFNGSITVIDGGISVRGF